MSASLSTRVSIAVRTVIIAVVVATAAPLQHAQSTAYFIPTDSTRTVGAAAPAVSLADGTVLLIGDIASFGQTETYDLDSGRFTAAAAMIQARKDAASVLLADGRVLVAGGSDGSAAISSVEVYDPATRGFAPAGHLLVPRIRPAIAQLPDGRVLVAGGLEGTVPLASAEVFNPATGVSEATADMTAARAGFAAALENGTVLVIGAGPSVDGTASADLFDPAANGFSSTGGLNVPRDRYAVSRLADGRVLVSGGTDASGSIVAQAEVYDAVSGTFRAGAPMVHPRQGHGTVLLRDGTVLAVGGTDQTGHVASTEIFDPASGFSAGPALTQPRVSPVVAALPDGGALVVHGQTADAQPLAIAERYWQDRRDATATSLTSSLPSSQYGQPVTYTAVVSSALGVPSGRVQFIDAGTLLGEADLDAGGRATLVTSTTSAGSRAIVARYLGAVTYLPSESAGIQQIVAAASATISLAITPLQRQYSDPVTFVATLSPAGPAQTVTFKLGTLTLGSAEAIAGRATLQMPVPASMPFGTRMITAVLDSPNYLPASASRSMTVLKEDARVAGYASGYVHKVYTPCSTCNVAKVILRVAVKDISVTPDANGDITPGDIRNAVVNFTNKSTYALIGSAPVTLPDPNVLTAGEAAYEWTVDLGGAAWKSFNVGYSVSGAYSRTSYDYFTVTVYRPK